MDAAKNATRWGGLTLVVGLGIAVSSGQGIAHADTDSADSGSSTSAESSASSASSDTESTTSDAQERDDRDTDNADDANPGDDPRELPTRRAKIRDLMESAAAKADSEATLAEVAAVDDVVSETPKVLDEQPVPEVVVAPTEVPEVPVEEIVEPEDVAPEPEPAPEVTEAVADDETSSEQPVVEVVVATDKDSDTTEVTVDEPDPFAADPTDQVTEVTVDPVVPESSSPAPAVTSVTTVVSVHQPQLSPLIALLAIPLRIVTGLLGLVGLAPSAVPGAPVSPVTKLVEFAWVALRRINSFFFNSTPTATVTLQQPTATGVIAGRVVGFDADGDPLAYQLIEQPTNGTVTLDSDGSFTYTPHPGFVAAGGPDLFRVAVIDKGFHFHGLLGFLKPRGGHGTVATVALNLAPGSAAPVITPVDRNVSYSGGDIVGTVRITDDGDDPLDVTVSQPDPAWATVTIVHVEADTWRWILSPGPDRPAEATAVAFTITAGDGQTTTSLPVEVTVPAPSAVVVDATIVHLPPTTVVVSPISPVAVAPTGDTIVVTWNHHVYLTDPTTVTTVDVSLPPGSIVAPVTSGEIIVVNPDLTVSTAVITGSTLELTTTGITLTGTPTSLTTVGDGTLVVASGNNLNVHTNSQPPLEVYSSPDPIEKVVWIRDSDTIVTTTGHRVSILGTIFDLGGRAMSSETGPSVIGVEERDTIDFGTGVIGNLATQGESIYVTVTDDGVTRLIKYDVNYYGLEERSSVELTGSASSLAINEDGGYAYVADTETGAVTIVAIQDYYGAMETIETIHTGPGHVSALPGGRLAITDPTGGSVTIIQLD